MHKLAVEICSCSKFEQIKELKMKTLKETNLSLTNNEAIQNMLQGIIVVNLRLNQSTQIGRYNLPTLSQ